MAFQSILSNVHSILATTILRSSAQENRKFPRPRRKSLFSGAWSSLLIIFPLTMATCSSMQPLCFRQPIWVKSSVHNGLIAFSWGIRTVLVDNGPILMTVFDLHLLPLNWLRATLPAYMSIVGENGEKLPADQQFAMDETGVLLGSDWQKQCIVNQQQLQAAWNSSGNHDLITYAPIISGAGKLVESLVISPGKKLMKNWVAKNPNFFAWVFLLQSIRFTYV